MVHISNYFERYPREFAHFTPDEATEVEVKNRQQLINAYDNSIRYTDYFLHHLIQILDSTNHTTALYYSPDHGEDFVGRRPETLPACFAPSDVLSIAHTTILMVFRSVPAGIPGTICNGTRQPDTTGIYKSAFHTMLIMASITTPLLNTGYSLISPDYKARRRMYLTDHDQPIFWYNSGLKKQDKAMIEKIIWTTGKR